MIYILLKNLYDLVAIELSDKAPVVKWISCRSSEPLLGVRIPPGAQVLNVRYCLKYPYFPMNMWKTMCVLLIKDILGKNLSFVQI